MKVSQFQGRTGKPVANQFLVHCIENVELYGEWTDRAVSYFQSYNTMIAKQYRWVTRRMVELDSKWDCSRTTLKYLTRWLGETKQEIQAKINSGEYRLVDLNS